MTPNVPCLISAPKLVAGDQVAVLSPGFAAPAVGPAVHEQAMRRLAEATGLVPVEYPTTQTLNASPEARAADVNAAFANPDVRAILTTIGGDNQIAVTPHLNAELAKADPKPFLGYSDNTNILNWLWCQGVKGFHGGSTQVQIGPGPHIDDIHLQSLRAALMTGGSLDIIDPGESEDFRKLWQHPATLAAFGCREHTEPWAWSGPLRTVSGHTWGGCVEVLDQLALAGRLPPANELAGAILLLETSEERPPARWVQRWVRAMGEGGLLGAVAGVLIARPPTSDHGAVPAPGERARLRQEQRTAVLAEIGKYNPDAVVCIGVPFGHTRPQWILPYGGLVHLDGAARTITAHYD